MRRRGLAALLLCVAVGVTSCGPKTPPVAPGAPHYPEFLSPVTPAAANSPDGEALSRGWQTLQLGDVGSAERQFTAVLKRQPRNDAAVASLGYAELAKRDPDKAIARFDQAVALKADSASALVGRGLAYAQSGRAAEAIASFEAARAAEPTLDLSGRIDALRFRAVEDSVARARAATAAGKLDDARTEYAAALVASPDSAPLLKELAGVERQAGDVTAARTHLERAIAVDPADRAARLQLADVLEGAGDRSGALRVLEAAERAERSPDVEARIAALRERADLDALPERYRRIAAAPTVTRADLAALLGVRLPGVLRAAPPRPVPLVTDASAGWAASWIAAVLRAGVMDAFPNHTFQPEGVVRRADLAAVVDRALSLLAMLDPPKAGRWQKGTATFTDLAAGHPAYDAANRAVSAKVLDAGPGGTFEPTRLVTGAEASDAVGRLEKLAGPKARVDRK